MDGEKVIEELDTLWFFSSIFSSPSSFPKFSTVRKITEPIFPDSSMSKQHNPKSPISQTEKNEASGTNDEVQVCSEVESNLHFMESDTVATMENLEKVEEERSRIDRSGGYKFSSKGIGMDQTVKEQFNEFMGFTYLGFNFADIELDGGLVPMVHRFQGSRSKYLRKQMPPFSDGMAMKEHLKSWAHAVACTVK